MIYSEKDDVSRFKKVINVYVAVSGMNTSKENFTGYWKVEPNITENKQYYAESNLHRAYGESVMLAILDAVKYGANAGWDDTLIKVHHYAWNLNLVVNSKGWEKWYLDDKMRIRRPQTHYLKNPDLWFSLMFISETVNIQLVELNRESDEYKDVYEKAREYFSEVFKLQQGQKQPLHLSNPRKETPREALFRKKWKAKIKEKTMLNRHQQRIKTKELESKIRKK